MFGKQEINDLCHWLNNNLDAGEGMPKIFKDPQTQHQLENTLKVEYNWGGGFEK